MNATVMRAESFQNGEPISNCIGIVTAQKWQTPGTNQVLLSNVSRLLGRVDCGDTHFTQFRKRRRQPRNIQKIKRILFCQKDMRPMC